MADQSNNLTLDLPDCAGQASNTPALTSTLHHLNTGLGDVGLELSASALPVQTGPALGMTQGAPARNPAQFAIAEVPPELNPTIIAELAGKIDDPTFVNNAAASMGLNASAFVDIVRRGIHWSKPRRSKSMLPTGSNRARRKKKEKDNELLRNAMFRQGGKLYGAAVKEYIKKRASRLKNIGDLQSTSWHPECFAQSMVVATVLAMWSKFPDATTAWFPIAPDEHNFPGYKDVLGYQGYEVMLGRNDGCFADGRCRWLGVVIRWWYMNKVHILMIAGRDMSGTGGWLGTYSMDQQLLATKVIGEMNLAEGITPCTDGGRRLVKAPRGGQTNLGKFRPVYIHNDDLEDARCVAANTRGKMVADIGTKRRNMKTNTNDELWFPLYYIREYFRKHQTYPPNVYYTFGTPDGRERTKWEIDPSVLLNVVQADVTKDAQEDSGSESASGSDNGNEGGNITNEEKLANLVAEFREMTVYLHYRGTVNYPDLRRRSRSSSGGHSNSTASAGPSPSGIQTLLLEDGLIDTRVFNNPNWEEIQEYFPDVSADKLRAHVPVPPSGPVDRIVGVSLHHTAAKMISDFTKMKDHGVLLDSHKHSLRAVHCVALGLLGTLKKALGEPMNEVEIAAAGNVSAEAGNIGDVCIFNCELGPNNTYVTPVRTDAQMAKSFNSSYSTYVLDELRLKYLRGEMDKDGAAETEEGEEMETDGNGGQGMGVFFMYEK